MQVENVYMIPLVIGEAAWFRTTTVCSDTGCISDAECGGTCNKNGDSCQRPSDCCSGLTCNARGKCEPIPIPPPACGGSYINGTRDQCISRCGANNCTGVAFSGGFITNCWKCKTNPTSSQPASPIPTQVTPASSPMATTQPASPIPTLVIPTLAVSQELDNKCNSFTIKVCLNSGEPCSPAVQGYKLKVVGVIEETNSQGVATFTGNWNLKKNIAYHFSVQGADVKQGFLLDNNCLATVYLNQPQIADCRTFDLKFDDCNGPVGQANNCSWLSACDACIKNDPNIKYDIICDKMQCSEWDLSQCRFTQNCEVIAGKCAEKIRGTTVEARVILSIANRAWREGKLNINDQLICYVDSRGTTKECSPPIYSETVVTYPIGNTFKIAYTKGKYRGYSEWFCLWDDNLDLGGYGKKGNYNCFHKLP